MGFTPCHCAIRSISNNDFRSGHSFSDEIVVMALGAHLALLAALQPPPALRAPAALGELPPASGRRAVLAAGLLAALPAAARAVGPETIKLEIKGYAEVTCPPELAQGRAGGSLGAGASSGIKQKCVEVSAAASNPTGKAVPDAAVFGRVFNKEDGSSVVANNPDGRTDAGQMAMIDSVPAGDNDLKFIFVAQQQTTCSTRPDPNGKRPPCDDTASIEGLLRFESMKAVSYPGGDRYKTYDQCEQNPFAEGCDG